MTIKGFSNNLSIDYFTGQSTPASNQASAPVAMKKPEQQQPIEDTKLLKQEKQSIDLQLIGSKTVLHVKDYYKKILTILLLTAGAAILFYRIRGKWVPYLWLARYRFMKKDTAMVSAYMILLNELSWFGLERKENQTLRNYARYVDSFFSTQEMTLLTNCYEQYMYHQNLPDGSWKEVRELWENLIKRTIT